MGEHDVGVALERFVIMTGKALAIFRRDQQPAGLFEQRVNPGSCQGFLAVEGLVHQHNELGKRLQPGEPRVAGEEPEKMVRRLDRADALFVADALRIDEGLMELEDRIAEGLQALVNGQRHFLAHSHRHTPENAGSAKPANPDLAVLIARAHALLAIENSSCHETVAGGYAPIKLQPVPSTINHP
jgi:hypothetical protein